jgi:rhodanese-related sulfurtransferase
MVDRTQSVAALRMYPKPGGVFMLDVEITPRDLAAQLQLKPEGLILLDVREPWEYATAQIAGSKSMPMGEIPSRAFQELDPEAHIITVCHAGVRSLNVAVWLRNQGFEKVQSLGGGIDAWSREIDHTVPRY